jgi:tRNA(His) guanylyltransferase
MSIDSLGDRIKRYEAVTRNYAVRRMPVVIRVDGKAFHTFTRHSDKPFDQRIINSMLNAAMDTASNIQGFKVGYVQSDEATFVLTDYDSLTTNGWFDYNLQKMVSISAAMMSVSFIQHYQTDKLPVFDSRAFNVPKEDIINVLLWRAKDWERNSLQMYSSSFFSHKELHGKKRADKHEMLHGIGKNWATDIPTQHKNGTFILRTEDGIISRDDILPDYIDIKNAVYPLIDVGD